MGIFGRPFSRQDTFIGGFNSDGERDNIDYASKRGGRVILR